MYIFKSKILIFHRINLRSKSSISKSGNEDLDNYQIKWINRENKNGGFSNQKIDISVSEQEMVISGDLTMDAIDAHDW